MKTWFEKINGEFDQLGSPFPDSPRSEEIMRAEAFTLDHCLWAQPQQENPNPGDLKKIELFLRWAKDADALLWISPPPLINERSILFDSYQDFVLWTAWKIRAALPCSDIEMLRIRSELESLPIKVTAPRKLENSGNTQSPLEARLDLL